MIKKGTTLSIIKWNIPFCALEGEKATCPERVTVQTTDKPMILCFGAQYTVKNCPYKIVKQLTEKINMEEKENDN